MGGYKEHSSEHRVERAVEKDRNAGTFEGMGVLYTPHKKFSYTFIVGDLKNYSATNSCFINGLHTLHEFIPTFLKKNIHIQQAIKFQKLDNVLGSSIKFYPGFIELPRTFLNLLDLFGIVPQTCLVKNALGSSTNFQEIRQVLGIRQSSRKFEKVLDHMSQTFQTFLELPRTLSNLLDLLHLAELRDVSNFLELPSSFQNFNP